MTFNTCASVEVTQGEINLLCRHVHKQFLALQWSRTWPSACEWRISRGKSISGPNKPARRLSSALPLMIINVRASSIRKPPFKGGREVTVWKTVPLGRKEIQNQTECIAEMAERLWGIKVCFEFGFCVVVWSPDYFHFPSTHTHTGAQLRNQQRKIWELQLLASQRERWCACTTACATAAENRPPELQVKGAALVSHSPAPCHSNLTTIKPHSPSSFYTLLQEPASGTCTHQSRP